MDNIEKVKGWKMSMWTGDISSEMLPINQPVDEYGCFTFVEPAWSGYDEDHPYYAFYNLDDLIYFAEKLIHDRYTYDIAVAYEKANLSKSNAFVRLRTAVHQELDNGQCS